MIRVSTPRHPPCDGGASKLHGHPQSRLPSPRRDPDIRPFESILGTGRCGNGPQTIKDAATSQLERPPREDSARATDPGLSSSRRLPPPVPRRRPPPPPQLA